MSGSLLGAGCIINQMFKLGWQCEISLRPLSVTTCVNNIRYQLLIWVGMSLPLYANYYAKPCKF